jgi:hypothetical protein
MSKSRPERLSPDARSTALPRPGVELDRVIHSGALNMIPWVDGQLSGEVVASRVDQVVP